MLTIYRILSSCTFPRYKNITLDTVKEKKLAMPVYAR